MTNLPMSGDLDRLAFAVHEAADISTAGIIARSGVPWSRAKAALDELVRLGRVIKSDGHHHGDGDFCQCSAGAGLPLLTHWCDRDGH